MTIFEGLFAAAFISLWLYLGFLTVRSVRTGRLGFAGSRDEIKRRERPFKFWFYWLAYAWPFVFLPLLIAVGWLMLGVGL